MTLPTLVQRQQKKVVATRLKQTYSQLYQAINMAQAQYGDMKNWSVNDNYQTSIDPDNPSIGREKAAKFAEIYLIPYLKYNGTPTLCKLEDKGYSSYYTKDGRLYVSQSSRYYIIELVNGVTLLLFYNGNAESYSYPSIFVDINGKSKPNILGRDFFMFDLDSVNTMKIRPAGYGYSRDDLLKFCEVHDGNTYEYLRCTGLIVLDGWEIKNDYPW